MLKNRIIYVLVLIIAMLFRIAYTGYLAGMFLIILLILPIFSWLISLPGAYYTRISISVPDQVLRGSNASAMLRIQQSRLFSTGNIGGKMTCRNPVDGTVVRSRIRNMHQGFPLDTSHCCTYELSFNGIHISDLLGLFPMPVRRVPNVTVSIMPIPAEPPEHPDWSMSSSMLSKPFSGASNPYDLRDYRTGDTLRSIHWKKSAALDKTVVRDTLEPAERIASVWIDWPENASGRDYALDQLAWCIIYLNQNFAGINLQWFDRNGRRQAIYAGPGEIDNVVSAMMYQPAGKLCGTSVLYPNEILLSSGTAEEGSDHAE